MTTSQSPRHAPQLRVPATYMRGGTSKGVFFTLDDLPDFARAPGKPRDALLLRVIGAVRAAVGADFPVWCKIDACERG